MPQVGGASDLQPEHGWLVTEPAVHEELTWEEEGQLPRILAAIGYWSARANLGGLELHQGHTLPMAFRTLDSALLFIRHPLRPEFGRVAWRGDLNRQMLSRHLSRVLEPCWLVDDFTWQCEISTLVEDPFRPPVEVLQRYCIGRIVQGHVGFNGLWKYRWARHLDGVAIANAYRSGTPIPVCCPGLSDIDIALRAHDIRARLQRERTALLAGSPPIGGAPGQTHRATAYPLTHPDELPGLLRRDRLRRHLTRKQVADLAGLDVRTIRAFETGERTITMDALLSWLSALQAGLALLRPSRNDASSPPSIHVSSAL